MYADNRINREVVSLRGRTKLKLVGIIYVALITIMVRWKLLTWGFLMDIIFPQAKLKTARASAGYAHDNLSSGSILEASFPNESFFSQSQCSSGKRLRLPLVHIYETYSVFH